MTLAIDASSPATALNTVGTTQTVTSVSFTPPANSLLVILWSANMAGGDTVPAPTITDNLGAHLTYTLGNFASQGSGTTANGQAAIFTAPVSSSAAMTVTVTCSALTSSGFRHSALRILVMTDGGNLPTVGTNARGGVTVAASTLAAAYTATQTGSWGFLSVSDWDDVGAETAGTGTTLIDSADNSAQFVYGFFRRTTADGVNGSATTQNVTFPANTANAPWVAIEIKGAAAASGPTARPANPGKTWKRRYQHHQTRQLDPPPAAPVASTWLPGLTIPRRSLRKVPFFRTNSGTDVPDGNQLQPPAVRKGQTRSRRRFPLPPRSGSLSAPPDVLSTFVGAKRRARRIPKLTAEGDSYSPPWTQVTPPTNPAATQLTSVRGLWRLLQQRSRRGNVSTPVQDQDTLTSTLDLIPTAGTAPTVGNSNISATANNGGPTIFASTDLQAPHFGTTVTKYTMSVSTAAMVAWDTGKWTPQAPQGFTLYNRFYLFLAALPGSTLGVTAHTTTGFVASSTLRLTATGRLSVFQTGGTTIGTMATSIPVGQWVRVETRTLMDATVGVMQVRLYLSPESLTPDEDFTSSNGNTINAQTAIARVAIGNLGGGTTATHYFADVAWSDYTWLGPIGLVNPSFIFTVANRVRRAVPRRRTVPVVTVPAQVAPAINPAITQLTTGRFLKLLRGQRRGATGSAQWSPEQGQPPKVAVRSWRKAFRPRYGRTPTVVPPQQAAAPNPAITQFGSLWAKRWTMRRYGRVANPTPAQQTPPTNPSITQLVTGRAIKVLRGQRRGKTGAEQWRPAQQAVTANPSITQLVSVRIRLVIRALRRSQAAKPVPEQVTPLPPTHHAQRPMASRRGRVSGPPIPQSAPPPQLAVERVKRPTRRIRRALGRFIPGGSAPTSTAVSSLGSTSPTAFELGAVGVVFESETSTGSSGSAAVQGPDETGSTSGPGMSGSAS